MEYWQRERDREAKEQADAIEVGRVAAIHAWLESVQMYGWTTSFDDNNEYLSYICQASGETRWVKVLLCVCVL